MHQLAPDLYRLEIPLPGSPLKEIYNFLILGGDRHLLIDTGFNDDACEEALLAQLEELGVSLDNTDIFLTHMHVDHSALACRLKRPTNSIYMTATDRAMVDGFLTPEHWSWITESNVWTGVPKALRLKTEAHVAYRTRAHKYVEIDAVEIGHILTVGEHRFEVVDLAGHTPGHAGLWEPETGILFCGDHILGHISPNITTWDLENDYLGIFCENLLRVKEMNVKQLYPAHREPPQDVNARIDELIEHHQHRLNHILQCLEETCAPMTCFELAQHLTWSSRRPLLEMLPQQRWFACSETLAHMRHLLLQGKVDCDVRDNVHYYTRKL